MIFREKGLAHREMDTHQPFYRGMWMKHKSLLWRVLLDPGAFPSRSRGKNEASDQTIHAFEDLEGLHRTLGKSSSVFLPVCTSAHLCSAEEHNRLPPS